MLGLCDLPHILMFLYLSNCMASYNCSPSALKHPARSESWLWVQVNFQQARSTPSKKAYLLGTNQGHTGHLPSCDYIWTICTRNHQLQPFTLRHSGQSEDFWNHLRSWLIHPIVEKKIAHPNFQTLQKKSLAFCSDTPFQLLAQTECSRWVPSATGGTLGPARHGKMHPVQGFKRPMLYVYIYIYNQNEKMTGSSKKTIKCMQIKSDCKQKRFFFYQQPFLGIVRIIHHRISTGWASQRLCSDHVQSWALLSKSCIQVPQVRPTRQRCIVVIQLTRLRSRWSTLHKTNISHLGKRKIIFKHALGGDKVSFQEGTSKHEPKIA